MFDAHKNFAYGIVAVAPVGGSHVLTLRAGDGAGMPTAPFNAVVCPANQMPIASNATVVRVTERVGDVLTFTPAQEGSTMMPVLAGYQLFAAVTAKTLQDIEGAVTAEQSRAETAEALAAAAVVAERNRALAAEAAAIITAEAASDAAGIAAADTAVERARAEAAEGAIASSGGAVASVFGRSGVVTAQTGDYTASQVAADPAGSAATEKTRAEAAEGSLATGITSAIATAESASDSAGTAAALVATEKTRAQGAESTLATSITAAIATAEAASDSAGTATADTKVERERAEAALTAETTRAETAEALKAPLASPALTGAPTAPTQTAGDASTKLATTAFVAGASLPILVVNKQPSQSEGVLGQFAYNTVTKQLIGPKAIVSGVVGPFPSNTTVDDTFVRAPENPLAKGWSGPLYLGFGNEQLEITSSGQATAPSVGGSSYWNAEQIPDVDMFFQVAALAGSGDNIAAFIRCAGIGLSFSGYRIKIEQTFIEVHTLSATLKTYSVSVANGDWVGVRMVGTRMSIFHKVGAGAWVLLGELTDTSFSTGYMGVGMLTNLDAISSFSGGPVVRSEVAEWSTVPSIAGGESVYSSIAGSPEEIIAGTITRSREGAAIEAPVEWPDGTKGVYRGTESSSLPGAVDSYTITRVVGEATHTYTQPQVTRNSEGVVTSRPAITVV